MKKITLLVCTSVYMLMCSSSANAQCRGTLKIARSGPVNYNYCTDGPIDIYLSGVGAGWNFAIYKDTMNPANKISGTSSVFDMPFSNTVYYATADSAGCLQKIDSLIVTVNTTIVITAGPDTTICIGDSVQLNASANGLISYSWFPPIDLIGRYVKPIVTTTYTVTGTNQSCIGTATCTITVNPMPVISTSPDTTICAGGVAGLNACGSGLTFQWSPNSGLNDSTSCHPFAAPTSTTTYTVVITDLNLCRNSASVTVTVNPLPVANFSISADTSQLHHYIVVNNSSGKAPLSYIWSWGDGLYDTIPYPTHTYAASGFYNICLTVTDSNGCINTFCDSSFHILRTTNYMIYITVVPPVITATEIVNISTPQVTISPNPATNQLTIHTSSFHANEAATVSIMNVLGKTSPPAPLHIERGDALIDVSKLAAGMYFLQLKSESGSEVKKFVKE